MSEQEPRTVPLRLEMPPTLEGPEYMAWLSGVVMRLDSELALTRETVQEIRKDIGEDPEASTDGPGSGMKKAIAILHQDRRFFRLLASVASGTIVVAELVRLVYFLI